ncbi:MAG: hypothetical protein ACP6IS_01905 [Candidatus Asgardarchaeia archaeon]
MKYFTLNFHTNMWYAEYTHSETIHRFPNIYRKILDVLEKYPEIRASWDIECSITIPYLLEVAPDVIKRIREGVEEGRYEILVDTWSFTLATLHTPKELDFQIHEAINCLKSTFGKVSTGFYPQETAYAEPLPRFLRKFGFEFIPIKKDTVEFILNEQFNPSRQGVYNLVGSDGTRIKTIFFESTYQSLHDFVIYRFDEVEDESLIFLLGDAEIFSKEELGKLFEKIKTIEELEPILPSEYVTSHEPIMDLRLPDCTWALGGNDYNLWCRDPWDHYLWTLNERARHMLKLAKKWMRRVPKITSEYEELYNSAFLDIMLGQNSDKFGWNPCYEKRKEGEVEFLNAIFKLDRLTGILTEKAFNEAPEKYLKKRGIKRFLIDYDMLESDLTFPVSFNFKVEHKRITSDLTLSTENENISFALSSEIKEDEYLIGGTCVFLLETRKISSPSMMYLEHGSPSPISENPFSKDKESIYTPSSIITPFNNIASLRNIKDLDSGIIIEGTLFDYYVESSEDDFSPKVIEHKENPSKPYPIYYRRKIREEDKNIDIVTEYRFYSQNGLIEVLRSFYVKKAFIGVLYPLVFKFKVPIKKVWRSVLGEVTYREPNEEEIYPILDNWAILEFDHAYVLLSGNGLVHSIKEALVTKDKLVLAPIETLYEENPVEHINGILQFQILFKIAKKERGILELLIRLANAYSKPPFIIDMSQHEGPRAI